jgi:hypothetical protein
MPVVLPGPEQLHGNFQGMRLSKIIQEYLEALPDEDPLPSEGILNTVLIFLRSIFFCLGPDHPYRWEGSITGGEEGEDVSGIHITNTWPVDPKFMEQRPVVLVRLTDRRFRGMHMDQMKHYNAQFDVTTKHDLIDGALPITVLSRLPLITQRLSEWIGISFRLLAKHLTFAHKFHTIFPQISFTEPRPAGDLIEGNPDKDYFQASAVIPYTWGWTGRVSPTNPLSLKGVQIRMVAYGRPVLDGVGALSGIVDPDDFDSYEHLIDEQDI